MDDNLDNDMSNNVDDDGLNLIGVLYGVGGVLLLFSVVWGLLSGLGFWAIPLLGLICFVTAVYLDLIE